jgi:hypothetical protein
MTLGNMRANGVRSLAVWCGLLLVNKTFCRHLGLCANPLLTFETCHATVLNHVGDARPDRHLKHRHSKDCADDGNTTASYQA